MVVHVLKRRLEAIETRLGAASTCWALGTLLKRTPRNAFPAEPNTNRRFYSPAERAAAVLVVLARVPNHSHPHLPRAQAAIGKLQLSNRNRPDHLKEPVRPFHCPITSTQPPRITSHTANTYTMSLTLTDRAVYITGAGSGIGKATALRFAAAGSKLFLVGRTESKLVETQKEIAALYPNVQVAYATVDLQDKKALEASVKTAVDKFGGLTVVVANGTPSSTHSHGFTFSLRRLMFLTLVVHLFAIDTSQLESLKASTAPSRTGRRPSTQT